MGPTYQYWALKQLSSLSQGFINIYIFYNPQTRGEPDSFHLLYWAEHIIMNLSCKIELMKKHNHMRFLTRNNKNILKT